MGALLFSLPLGWGIFTNILLLLFFVHAIIFLRREDWRGIWGSAIAGIPAAFYLLHLISLLWSDDLADGLLQLETKLGFLLAPMFIVASRRHFRADFAKVALRYFVAGCVAAALFVLFYASYRSLAEGQFYQLTASGGKQYFFLYKHLSSPLMHPSYLATYLGLAFFISLHFLWQGERKVWYGVIALLMFLLLILLQARMVLLAMMLMVVAGALFFAWRKGNWRWLMLPLLPVLALLAFMALADEGLRKRYLQIPDFSYDISGRDFNSATYRLAQWHCALDAIAVNPVWGAGIGDNRQVLLDAYKENKFYMGLERRFNAHNQFLETSLVCGVAGLALLLLMLGYFAYRFWLARNYLALLCLLFFSLCLLTESMFERSWAILLFVIFFPLLATLDRYNKGLFSHDAPQA